MKQCNKCQQKRNGLKKYCIVEVKNGGIMISYICAACRIEAEKKGFAYKMAKGDNDVMKYVARARKDLKDIADRHKKLNEAIEEQHKLIKIKNELREAHIKENGPPAKGVLTTSGELNDV